MPRKAASEGPNKSALIREYKTKDANIGPKAIVSKLKSEHGIEVSAQFVSTVLSQAKKKSGKKGRRGRPPGSGKAAKASPAKATSGGLSVELLLKAKKLANELGGVEEAKAALDALARIVG